MQAVLVQNAETIGIPAEKIFKGDFQENIPIKPPGIMITAEAGDFVFRNDPNPFAMTITLFFITRPVTTKGEDIAQAISDSIALGWRAFAALREAGLPLRYPFGAGVPPVKLDTVKGELVASTFQAVSAFSV